MRTEQEMLELILGVAKVDERIRAVYMNGSRANPNVAKDRYQDYDIVYVVTETATFLADKSWISVFGDFAMVQEPDSNDLGWGQDFDFNRSYGWLMLFTDGTRIDLHIEIKNAMLEGYTTDSLTVPLLDKDGILPPIPSANDQDYWVKPPAKPYYDGCCNEFWWCLNNVAKGIARDELPYVMEMYNHYVRDMLNRLLEWYIGMHHDFSVSSGKMGKYYKKYLPKELYDMYVRTYSDAHYENIWAAVFTACDLFHSVAVKVGGHFGFDYKQADEDGMRRYLEMVKSGAFDG
jgi:aminoglycoside 6-adenylyltransferase